MFASESDVLKLLDMLEYLMCDKRMAYHRFIIIYFNILDKSNYLRISLDLQIKVIYLVLC